MRKAGQRCANGYLNQMGVPVLGVRPLVLVSEPRGWREGTGKESSRHAAFFFQRLVFFSVLLFREGIPVRFLPGFLFGVVS